MATRFRIAVVGSGAIGIYYGGGLAAAGCDMHFLIRGNLAEIHHDGFRRRGKEPDGRDSALRCPRTPQHGAPVIRNRLI